MAPLFTMTFNIEKALREMGVVMTGRIPAAVARGINRTAASEKVALSREIADEMSLTIGAVKKDITVENATARRLTARVIARGLQIPLINYRASGPEPSRGRGRGVSYRMFGVRHQLPHAFIAKVEGPLPSGVRSPGHRGVFIRKGLKRLPIRELFGPSIAAVFKHQVPLGEARRQENLLKNVKHEIEFALSKGA